MKISNYIYLLVAITLLALASPAIKWLLTYGGKFGLARPGSISFCNVLFVGNLCAGILTFVLFNPKKLWLELRSLRGRMLALLALNTIFAVAIPAMMFQALETTTVTNLVLLGRCESVAYALIAFLLLRSPITKAQLIGYAVIVAGILALVLVQGMYMLARGDLLILGAALVQGLAASTGKKFLSESNSRVFVLVRNFGSAVIFFVIAIYFFGPGHFADAFAADFVLVMIIYALVIVMIGQLAWYRALGVFEPKIVANWSNLMPAMGILFACLLLDERPALAQWIGGLIIGVGIYVSTRGRPKPSREAVEQQAALDRALAAG